MIRAVICDDEKAAHDIIQYAIEREGFPIEIVGTAENGMEALRLIQEKKPDLAFMDIHMPFMNGFEVIQKAENVKIIMITAYDSFEYAQKALRLEVSDILAKPINLSQLSQSIERAIGGKYTDNDTVNRVLSYIQKHYRENIRLEDLARETYCTESYISRLFKQHMNETVVSYIHRVRIKKAEALLRQDGLTVQEAAEEVGYQSLNNFYKYFKTYMGETPASFVRKKK